MLGLGITMVLHEAVNGLLARRYGAKPRYGGVVAVFPYAYCDPAWTFRRGPYLVVALGPLVVLDLLALAAMLWVPGVSPIAYAVLVLNTSGAVGDLWVAWRVLQAPAQVLVLEPVEILPIPLLRMATYQSDPASGSGSSVDLVGLLVRYVLVALGVAALRRWWNRRWTQ